MSEQQADRQRYMVSVYEVEGAPGSLIFTLVPKGLQQARGADGHTKRLPQYIVMAREDGGAVAFDWGGTQDAPGDAQQEIEQEVLERMNARREWVSRVSELVDLVEQWARDLGWATRRITKRLDDPYVGKHEVPALLMQEDTTRVLLEPVGRSAAGVEGVVDLYLMPAYDDIASLYYSGGAWSLHYLFTGAPSVARMRDAPAKPLSKESLQKVLAEMKQHAASA